MHMRKTNHLFHSLDMQTKKLTRFFSSVFLLSSLEHMILIEYMSNNYFYSTNMFSISVFMNIVKNQTNKTERV